MNPITERSTKKEILEAYKALQEQSVGDSPRSPKVPQEKSMPLPKSLVGEALSVLHQLKNTMNNTLDAFTGQINEFRKRTQEEEDALNRQMQQKKDAWEREQQEYAYQLSLQRKKEQGEHEFKKQEQERQFNEALFKKEQAVSEREKIMKEREEEFNQLGQAVQLFPEKLSQAVEEAISKTKKELDQQAKISAELTQKDIQREREIGKLTVHDLEETVKRQANQIAALERQLAQANQRAQELAVSVIQSSGMAGKRLGDQENLRDVKEKH